jgi:heterogeneous nuclear ribonucleoprotein R
LDDIYSTGKLAHSDLDDRALDALKEFPVDGALTVLKQFLDSNLEHVSNKSAYLCGVMKTYRQKSRSGQTSVPQVQSSPAKGPDEAKIKAILERTGYSLDVTTGQRKYGGPPPNWDAMPPGNGCEVFCGKIPKDMYEDELIPLFEKCGAIWDLRLMMDPMTGLNRGYAFVTFTNRDGAHEAVRQLNDFEIRKGKKIGVTISYNNHRLFVGNIPKNRDHDELFEEFSKHAPGLTEVIIYSSPDDRKKNRGFCFLEYESHKAASLAKRRLGTSRVKVWGCDIIVDWADPQEEPDDETMSKVKVLYVRNLTQDVTEEKLKESFEPYGKVERVKKIKDYAFVHFEDRDSALKAMNDLNCKDVGGSNIEISLAKPPSDKKKKEEILRARERRMMQMMAQRPPVIPPMPMARGRGIRGAPMGRGDFDNECFDPFSVGFGDFRGLLGDPSMFDPELYPELADDLYFDFPGPTPAQSVPFLPASSSRFNNNRHPPHLNHHQSQTVRSSAILE